MAAPNSGRFAPRQALYRRHNIPSGVSYVVLEDIRGNTAFDVPYKLLGFTHEVLTGKTVTVEQTLTAQQDLINAISREVADGLDWYPTTLDTYDLEVEGKALLYLQSCVTGIRVTVTGGGLRIEEATANNLDPSSSSVSDASDTVKGIVELATAAETLEGIDPARAVTPAGLKSTIDTPLREEVAGTTYTIDADTTATLIVFTSADPVAVTLANSIVEGRVFNWIQKGVGQVTFAAGSGATLNNRLTQFKSAGQWAVGSLICDENAGSAAKLILAGETAA